MPPHFTVWYGTFSLTPTLLTKVERCQQWFLKNVFYVPKFAPCQLLLKLSGFWPIDSEIGLRKVLFLGRLLTGDKMAPVVRNLFQIRSQSYFDPNIVSLGVLQVYVRPCTNIDSSVILTHGSQILCFRHIHNGNQL